MRAFLTDALQDGRVSVNSSAMAAIIIFPINWPFGSYTADNILKHTPLKSNFATREVTNLGRFKRLFGGKFNVSPYPNIRLILQPFVFKALEVMKVHLNCSGSSIHCRLPQRSKGQDWQGTFTGNSWVGGKTPPKYLKPETNPMDLAA